MIISREYKFIFIHVPKCAGSSVRYLLKEQDSYKNFFWHTAYGNSSEGVFVEFDKAHLTLDDFANFYPDDFRLIFDYTTFTFSRHPWLRLVSSFFYIRRDLIPLLRNTSQKSMVLGEIYSQFQKYVEMLVSTTCFLDKHLVHATPQHKYYFYKGKNLVDISIALEEPSLGFSLLKKFVPKVYELLSSKFFNVKLNSNTHYRIHSLGLIKSLPSVTYDQLLELYAIDFDLFGYSPNDFT